MIGLHEAELISHVNRHEAADIVRNSRLSAEIEEANEGDYEHQGVRHWLASTFIRLGTRIDRDAADEFFATEVAA